MVRIWALTLLSVLSLVTIAGSASAHIDVGIDKNHDGDCNDPGEKLAEIPGPIHDDVCLPSPTGAHTSKVDLNPNP